MPFAISALLTLVLAAQAPITPLERDAQTKYQAKDWPATVELYGRVIEADAKNGWAHYFRGVALQELGKHDEAIRELDSANTLGVPPVQTALRYGRSYAQMGKKDDAFAALERAITLGFRQKNLMETDALLAPIRTDARFAGLLSKLDRAATPCRFKPESRQFDFWIGEWDVYTALAPATAPIATSRIESAEDGCAVLEHYTQNGGYTGRSINAYDTTAKKWKQYYVDNTGRVTEYTGELVDGKMIFNAGPSRMTFLNEGPDQVHQIVERSTDGKTWMKTFDGIYKRRKPTQPAPFAQKLPALDGKQLRVTQVEVQYAPGQGSPSHSHPCPVIVRVLEGAVVTKVDNNPEVTYKEGDTFYEPPNGTHAVSRNASTSVGARILATFLCDSDGPLTKPPGN